MSDKRNEFDYYINEQLMKAVGELVGGQGGIADRLETVVESRLCVIDLPHHRFPADLQTRFDRLMERVRERAWQRITLQEMSGIATEIFSLWFAYSERRPRNPLEDRPLN